MKAESKLQVYEFNGTELKPMENKEFKVRNHWNRKSLVVIKVGRNSYTVLADELVLACVKQDLTNTKSIDLNLVVKVRILSSEEIQAILPVGEPIVVNATEVDGVYKAHTINVTSVVCDQL